MKLQCSTKPYLETKDGIAPSELWRTVYKMPLKSIVDEIKSLMDNGIIPTIEDYSKIIGVDINNLGKDTVTRIFATYLYSEAIARTPNNATGYPVYETGELKLENLLAELSTDVNFSENVKNIFKSIANKLNINIENVFNPIVQVTPDFNELDYNNCARLLQGIYLDIRSMSNSERIERYGDRYDFRTRSGFKAIILSELQYRIKKALTDPNTIRTKFNDDAIKSLFENLYDPNSSMFEYFLSYINKNLGITRNNKVSAKTVTTDESTEEYQSNDVEDIEVIWDEIQRERIDRKNSLSSYVKSEVAKLVGQYTFKNQKANKWYLPIPTDINTIWNNLINAHKYDVTPLDFYKRIKELAGSIPELAPILEKFNNVFVDKNLNTLSNDSAFVNAYISGIGLAVNPVRILLIDDKKASYRLNNQEAFANKLYYDRFVDVLDSNIEYNLLDNISKELEYNGKNSKLLPSITRNKKVNIADSINKQMQVINYLGLDITRSALEQYYAANNNDSKTVSRINNILTKIIEDTVYRVNYYKENKKVLRNNVNGYLDELSKIATYDFNNLGSLSYLDVQGKLNYTPQYDSMLTKFLRGFITRTGVNTDYIKKVFAPYLNDPTLTAEGAEDNILIYDEKTGLGIFYKDELGNWEIHPNFIKDVENGSQFSMAAFNGVKIGSKGLKYREVQGSLYTYTELLLNMLDQYIFLTSDSPRSYTMSVKHIDVDDLFKLSKNQTRNKSVVKIYPRQINKDYIENSANSVFIFNGNTNGRLLGKPVINTEECVRGFENTIEIDTFRGFNYEKGKNTERVLITDADYDSYVADFEERVVKKIDKAIKEGKTIYLPQYGINTMLKNSAPKIYEYVETYFNNLKNVNVVTRITSAKINKDSKIFTALRKIVNSDVNKFNTFGEIIFQLRDNSDENLAKMRNRHNIKYWNGKAIYDKNGIPTGRSFKFLNLVYEKDGKSVNLPQHIADMNDISVEEVYRNMINKARGERYNPNYVVKPEYVDSFVESYIRWNATEVIDSISDIVKELYNTELERTDSTSSIFDDYMSNLIDDVYNLKINEYIARENRNIENTDEKLTLDKISSNLKARYRNIAKQWILNNYDIMDNDGVRLKVLEAILNHTVYNTSVNAIFNGDLDEYKNTTDVNKRVAQVIKNGLNSIVTEENRSPLKIVVMSDMSFESNIVDLMEGVDDNIIKFYKDKAKINDSQSIMTDDAFIKLMKATGRWNESNPIYDYVNDLMAGKNVFDPVKHSKLAEQVKVFGTARRRRGDFFRGSAVDEGQYDIFADEVDSVQIKDSTVVLFEALTRGTAMGQLYDWMKSNNVDQISPISAVKVSGITPVKIHNEDGQLDLNALAGVTNQSILYMQSDDFVVQQDVKADILDEETIIGSQLLKQIFEGLDWNNAIYKLDGKLYTGEELFKEFQKVLAVNIREDANSILYSLGIINNDGKLNLDEKGNVSVDIAKLVRELQKVIADDVDSITIRQVLELNEYGEPTISLSFPVIKNKLEKIIASTLTKNTVNQYLSGFHVPIRADIFTGKNELIFRNKGINKLYEDTEESKKLYNEYINDLVENGSITYSKDFIERCKKENRSLELRAEYFKDTDFYYAEVLVSPWSKEFYDKIGTTKTVKLRNGDTRTIVTVDIDKIDVEARRMLGIRIPTEGKQSMVIFEVVGFINSGASQAIFPQSLVTRTGWDFDIDSIYAYYRSVKFEQGKYTPIKFDEEFDGSETQIRGNFNRSLMRDKYLEIATYPQSYTNLSSEDYIKLAKVVNINFNIVFNPEKNKQPILANIIDLLKKDSKYSDSTNEYKKLANDLAYLFNKGYNRTYDSFRANILEYFDAIQGIDFNNMNNYNINQLYNVAKLLIDSRKYIQSMIEIIREANSKINGIEHSDESNDNYKLIKEKLNRFVEIINTSIEPKLKEIDESINNKYDEFIDKFKDLNDKYELVSREARNNRMIDIFTSIMTNKAHRNEIDKPNDTQEIIAASNLVNDLWGNSQDSLNPNNILDKILLNNMSMGSTVLKGHSVNMDTALAVLSTIHAKFKNGVRRVVALEEVPIPEGFKNREAMYTTTKSGKIKLTEDYTKFLVSILGKDNFKLIQGKTPKLWIHDVWINNDANNTHLDISGKRVELQANQPTSAILDVLKSGLGFNFNIHTLPIVRILSAGTTMELYNDKPNKFVNCNLFIHQPAIVEAVKFLEINLINNSVSKIEDAIANIEFQYQKELVSIYLKLVNSGSVDKIASHDVVKNIFNSKYSKRLNNEIITEIAKVLPNVTMIEPYGKFAYQTNSELIDNINNRDNHTADFIIRQLNVLNKFLEYKELADSIVSLQFMLKTETRIDSFYKADQKERNLTEYELPIGAIKRIINKVYNETENSIKSLIEFKDDPKFTKQINIDFLNLSSTDFKKKYNLTGEAILTYQDYKALKVLFPTLNTIADRQQVLDEYGLSYMVEHNLTLADGSDIVKKIFVGSFDSHIDYNTETFKKTEENSIYPMIESRYQYGHWMMSNGFGNAFVQRNERFKSAIISYLLSTKGYIDEATYKFVSDNVMNYLISMYHTNAESTNNSLPVLTPIQKDSVLITLGIHDEELLKKQKSIIKRLVKTIGSSYTIEDVYDYTQLSLAQQLQVIYNNKSLNDYITKSPEFAGSNVFKYLVKRNTKNNRIYDVIKIQLDDNDVNTTTDITNSILKMWNSEIPFIAHTIRQLLVYTYVTEGFNYAYNISKYIPIDLITKIVNNESYDKIIRELGDKYGYVDPSSNIGNYAANIKAVEENIKAGNVDIQSALGFVSRMKSDINPRILSLKQQQYRWESNKSSATIGWALDESSKLGLQNVATATITDANGISQEIYFETEYRLVNSEYANSEYVIKRGNKINTVYKRYLLEEDKKDPRNTIYVFMPVNPVLRNEAGLMSDESSIIPEYREGTDFYIESDDKTGKHVSRLEAVKALHLADPFKKLMKSVSDFTANDESDFNNDQYSETDFENVDTAENSNDSFEDNDIASIRESVGELKSEDISQELLTDTTDVDKTLQNTISQVLEETDNAIYITGSNKNNFYKGMHGDSVEFVDYTKSPESEALRISEKLKEGSIYINGDSFNDLIRSRNEVRAWVQSFIDNLFEINPSIEGLTTILNAGISSYIGNIYVDVPRTTYNIYKDPVVLQSKILDIDVTSDDALEIVKYTNANILVNNIGRLDKMARFMNTNHISSRDKLKALIKSFNEAEFEGGITEAIKEYDIDATKFAFDKMSEYVYIIQDIIKEGASIIKAIQYKNIRSDYGASMDYKNKILNLLNIIESLNTFSNIQKVKIEDTIYHEKTEEDIEEFERVYGDINKNIETIRGVIEKAKSTKAFLIEKAKDIIQFRLIDESRNPKYITAFSKLKEYLEDHDLDLTDYSKVQHIISQDEWNHIRSILFALDKDITYFQKVLDSAFTTGIDLIDLTGKAWDTANYKAKRLARNAQDRIEKALEDFQPGLSKNPKKREVIMHKFINEYGDLISSYSTDGLGDSSKTLKNKINAIINSNLYSSTGFITENTATNTISLIDEAIKEYNNEHTWELIEMTPEEQAVHYDAMEDMTYKEQLVYLQTHNIIQLNKIVNTTGRIDKVLYRIDFSKTPTNPEFAALSDKEKILLEEIRATIQQVLHDYNPNWINYYGKWDEIFPYLPTATVKGSLKSYFSIPTVGNTKTIKDIKGQEQYKLEATSLSIPKFIPTFTFRRIDKSESWNSYEKSYVEAFIKWFEKYNKLEGITEVPNSYDEIQKYKNLVLQENKRRKAKVMSYDIMDVIQSFTQELYNLKAINNFEVEYQLSKFIFNEPVNGISPKDRLKKASQQFDAMERRVLGISTRNNVFDIAAAALQRYTSMTYMYFNYTAGITNILKGTTDMIIESNKHSFVGSKNILQNGIKDVIKAVPKFLRDLKSSRTDDLDVAIIKDFEDIYQDTRDIRVSHTATSYWTEALDKLNRYGYAPNNMGEFTMQFGMLLAATHSHRVIGGEIMSFQDYYNDSLEKKLKEILSPAEYEKYNLFKDEFNRRIKSYENKKNLEFTWNHDYASQYLKEHGQELTKEQKDTLVKSIKESKAKYRAKFETYKTLHETLKLENGRLSFDADSGLTEAKLSQFKSRVKAINQSLHGIYNRVDRNSLQDQAVTDLLMQFKKWIRPNLNRIWGRRLGRIFYNEQLSGYEVPVLNVMFDMFRSGYRGYKDSDNIINGIGKYIMNCASFLRNISFYYNTLPVYEQAAAIKLAKTFASVAMAAVSSILIGSLAGDDDDEDNLLIQNLAYITTSYYQQVVEVVPPYGTLSMIKQTLDSPFASYKMIYDAISLLELVGRGFIASDEEMIYDRGIYKGQDKRIVKLNKILPIARQINKFNNLGATMSYYNMYNPLSVDISFITDALSSNESESKEE